MSAVPPTEQWADELAEMTDEDLVTRYWTMPVDNDDQADYLDAIAAELTRRNVGLARTLLLLGGDDD